MTKEQAVSTASDRLAAIETWTRRTHVIAFIVMIQGAIIAGAVLAGVMEYTRAKWAVAEGMRAASRAMAKVEARQHVKERELAR